jgi:alcohol dehydrogenase
MRCRHRQGRIIRRFPCVGGIDAVGTVEASTDARFATGDLVIAQSHGSACRSTAAMRSAPRARRLGHAVSRGLDSLEAITIGVAGLRQPWRSTCAS